MRAKTKGINNRKTILLVDDDSSFRFAMATELRAEGYLVASAEDGERAIRMIKGNGDPVISIDLVITDLVMPRKDGLRFCSELRQLDVELPVLVITGFLSPDVEKELTEFGCVHILEKPFSPKELLRKVEMLLSKEVREKE